MSHRIDTGSSQVDEERIVTHWECSTCGAQTDTERGIPAPCGCERACTHCLAAHAIVHLDGESLCAPCLADVARETVRDIQIERTHAIVTHALRIGPDRDTVRSSLPPESGHVAIPRPSPVPREFDTIRCEEVRS